MANIVHALILFCLLVLMHKGDAYEFVVGGQKGWSVPSDPNDNPYNLWAQKSRFQVGDSLVFNYQSDKDSVIEVNNQQYYEKCNTVTDSSSEKFSDGHTVIKLNKSGPHFFISGNKNHCLNNEKLLVIVLADRTNRNSNTNTNQTATAPTPSVSISVSPSPSPLSSHSTAELAPSPFPVQQVTGSSPPPLATDVTNPTPITPTPAPVTEPPPPNAASSILISFVGSVGALTVSLLV